MFTRLLHIAVWFAVSVLICSCERTEADNEGVVLHSMSDSVNAVRTPLYMQGDYDSVLTVSLRFYGRAVETGDTAGIVSNGSHIVQCYMRTGRPDSAGYYMTRLSHIVGTSPNVPESWNMALYYIVKGDYEFNCLQDYSAALDSYMDGYRISRRTGDIHGMVCALSYIVYVFYIYTDSNGMRYAGELYNLSLKEGLDGISVYYAYIAMAQMYYISADVDNAYLYLTRADSLASRYGMRLYGGTVDMIRGDICNAARDYEGADSCYSEALVKAGTVEPEIEPLVYLNFGRMCAGRGDWEKAAELFKDGLEVSGSLKNAEITSRLLQELSGLYFTNGQEEAAFGYWREWRSQYDMAEDSMARELNTLLFDYQQMQYDYERQSWRLALADAERRRQLAVAVSCAVCVIAVLLYVWHRKQQRMYKALVMRYQEAMAHGTVQTAVRDSADSSGQQPTATAVAADTGKQSLYQELYCKIESLMRDDRIYRCKDLSVEKLSDMLDTNRTYVSEAVNRYSGMSFTSFVNKYRIEEAVRTINRDGDNVLFKQLADQVGYNSATVFSSVFKAETGVSPSQYRKTLDALREKDNSVSDMDRQKPRSKSLSV